MVRRLAREEGVLVGISAAAGMVCSLKLAEELDEGVIVTIFCDSGTRYLSERFWQDAPAVPKAETLEAETTYAASQ